MRKEVLVLTTFIIRLDTVVLKISSFLLSGDFMPLLSFFNLVLPIPPIYDLSRLSQPVVFGLSKGHPCVASRSWHSALVRLWASV